MWKWRLLNSTSCFVCILFANILYGQNNFAENARGGNSFASDINGQPMYLKTEYIAEGSPYLYEEYCLAEIITMNGKVYQGVKAKINLQEKFILYTADSSETEMLALTPIKKIKFYSYVHNGAVFNEITFQGYNTAINSPGSRIYAILEDGPAKLFKEINITYTDAKRYGESTITRTFKKNETYYALLPGKEPLKKIEKNKNSVIALFEPKQALVIAYIEKQKLNCRNERDIIEIFKYYNSL